VWNATGIDHVHKSAGREKTLYCEKHNTNEMLLLLILVVAR
jgi:hypothetical protein